MCLLSLAHSVKHSGRLEEEEKKKNEVNESLSQRDEYSNVNIYYLPNCEQGKAITGRQGIKEWNPIGCHVIVLNRY